MSSEKQKYQIRRASLMYREKPIEDDRVYSETTFTSNHGYAFDLWFIDLTPNELIELCKAEESVIVDYDKHTDYWSLTIYDAYIE